MSNTNSGGECKLVLLYRFLHPGAQSGFVEGSEERLLGGVIFQRRLLGLVVTAGPHCSDPQSAGQLAVQAYPAAVESVFAEPGRSTQIIFPRGGVDHLQTLVSHCPVHTEVGCFSWLTSFCVTYSTEQWSVQAERLWQVLDLSNPLVHGSGEVVGMVQAAQDDAGEVDGLSEVAHQRALKSNNVPPGDFVTAGHGEQPLTLKNPVPRLNGVTGAHWDGSFTRLDFSSELPAGLSVGMSVSLVLHSSFMR